MKNSSLALAIVGMVMLIGLGSSLAQPRPGMMWRGSGGWGPGSQYNRMYNPDAVETIMGVVTSVDQNYTGERDEGKRPHAREDR